MPKIVNAAAYKFARLSALSDLRQTLRSLSECLRLKGTILLSPEGINLFVAGVPENIKSLLEFLRQVPGLADLTAKLSPSADQPFTRMLVRIKSEIIALGDPTIDPSVHPTPRIQPRELKDWLDQNPAVTLLDVRNDYEVELGTFDRAVPIGVDHFRDFPAAVQRLSPDLRHQPIVMFCTGGIRCEKAGPYLQQHGFRHVYQLDGGILKYFEEVGGEHFRGKCFVFDKRVAVEPDLTESDFALCYACQASLSRDDQSSSKYVAGVSCPHCYVEPADQLAGLISMRRRKLKDVTCPLPGSIPYDNFRPLNVSRKFDRAPLIDFLCAVHPHIPRSQWLETISKGRILCGDRIIQADEPVRDGQRLLHQIPQMVEPPVNTDIEVLFEDRAIVVVNKPAPLPVHPCGRFNRNSLTYILDQVYAPLFPRAQHRLDANTSGILVLAKTRRFANSIRQQFENRSVQKTYLALVSGKPVESLFSIELPISTVPHTGGRRFVEKNGQASRTDCRTIKSFSDGTALLSIEPRTGRTNQIRLHLWKSGLPIVGDRSYGDVGDDSGPHTLAPGEPPLCLVHWHIAFAHPITHSIVEFTAQPPGWLLDLAEWDHPL